MEARAASWARTRPWWPGPRRSTLAAIRTLAPSLMVVQGAIGPQVSRAVEGQGLCRQAKVFSHGQAPMTSALFRMSWLAALSLFTSMAIVVSRNHRDMSRIRRVFAFELSGPIRIDHQVRHNQQMQLPLRRGSQLISDSLGSVIENT